MTTSSSISHVALASVLLVAPPALAETSATKPATRAATQPATRSHVGHGHGHGSEEHGDHATVHHRFDDVAQWVERFDDPARDEWQKPAQLVAGLGIAAGDRVADIGAGTGYFERHLANAVGPTGTVYAVDVEPNLIEHLRGRAEKEDTTNVIPVLGSYDNPRLPRASVDLILIVDTYHHIDDRRGYFGLLAESLTKKGRLVIVDFEKKDAPVGPPTAHKLAREQVVTELVAAGYELEANLDELLPYQYALVFRRAKR